MLAWNSQSQTFMTGQPITTQEPKSHSGVRCDYKQSIIPNSLIKLIHYPRGGDISY